MEKNRVLMIRMMTEILKDLKATLYGLSLDAEARDLNDVINELTKKIEQ